MASRMWGSFFSWVWTMVNLQCIPVLGCQETDAEADWRALREKCLIPVCVGQDWSRQEKQLKGTCSAQVSALWRSDGVALNEKLIKWGIKFLPFPSMGQKQLQAVCAVWIDEKKRLNPVQISCSHFVTAEVLNLKDLPRLQMVVCLCLMQTRRIWCCYYRSILFNKSLSTCQKRGFCH